jgi:hypothetical protein
MHRTIIAKPCPKARKTSAPGKAFYRAAVVPDTASSGVA